MQRAIACLIGVLTTGSALCASAASGSKDLLTREEATARFKQIGRIQYALQFEFSAERLEFKGRAKISFQVKPTVKEGGSEIFVELRDAKVSAVTLNGKAWQDIEIQDHYNGRRLRLRVADLNKNGGINNHLEITYERPYQNDGVGLHRFQDPEDKRVYLYTHFEPYHAHLMFPCFDQPDLKATYSVEVDAPKDWQVVTNTAETKVTPTETGKHWSFPRSKPFSTYLFAMIAGPYAVWKSSAKVGNDEIPLRLLARKSQAKYVDTPEWFKITRRGLDYFSLLFAVQYPFEKYDQILVPEFVSGAMENVGAVTFNERAIFRSRVTQDRRRARANTILHEMAHQWFGNLTTMKWWNGLWLNESFATFMAALATETASDFDGTWLSFYGHDKLGAYFADQLETTHPVEQPVVDTETATASFDAITYGKGASALKQLYFLLGEDDFREGVQRYFEAFAFKNSTISEFFRKMGEASSMDLLKWQQLWLQTPGLNSIRAEWACSPDPDTGEQVLSKFDLIQGPEGEVRTHKVQLGLYTAPKDSSSRLIKQLKVVKKKSSRSRRAKLITAEDSTPVEVVSAARTTTVEALLGQPCPDFVFPNDGDHDYVRVELDSVSLAGARKGIHRIPDPLTRAMVWSSLWDAVVRAELKAQDYIETVIKQLPRERELALVNQVLNTLAAGYGSHFGARDILSGAEQAKWATKLETWARAQLLAAAQGSDAQLVWLQAYLRLATTPQAARWLSSLLTGKTKIAGLELEQDRRWEILRTASRLNAKNVREAIAAEKERDTSDLGRKSALTAESALADRDAKAAAIKRVTEESSSDPAQKLTLADYRAILSGIPDLMNSAWVEMLAPAYYARIAQLSSSPRPEFEMFEASLARWATPFECTASRAAEARTFLANHTNLRLSVSKSIRNAAQLMERCVKARAFSMPSTPELRDSDPSPSPSVGATQP